MHNNSVTEAVLFMTILIEKEVFYTQSFLDFDIGVKVSKLIVTELN